MPFAHVHYPFENREWFDSHYPGDFIVEYIGQTRGWFYTLHVLATALFDRPAFRSCGSHGIVLGNDGPKMSRSLRNYPDVHEVCATSGSDATRWCRMASPARRGGNLRATGQAIGEAVRRGLTGGTSVRLADWPDVSGWPGDEELTGAMDLVRIVCSTALGLRKAHQLRVRLPLASLTIAHPAAGSLAAFTGLIAEEV